MGTHTVGLVGSNGNVGRPTLLHLLKHVKQGSIKLVVFHRPGNRPRDLPSDVETRELDLEHDSVDKLTSLVKNVQVLISTIAPAGPGKANEKNLVDALAKTEGFVTFIPAFYSTQWTDQDLQNEALGPLLNSLSAAADHAKAIGVGTTVISTGMFDNWTFGMCFLGASIKKNELLLNDGQRKNGLPITLLDHLGSVLADIAASHLASIKNTTRSVVTYQPTGKQLIELFTKINGSEPTIKPWGAAEIAEAQSTPGLGVLKVAWARRWTEGVYTPLEEITDNKYAAAPSLEEIIKRYA